MYSIYFISIFFGFLSILLPNFFYYFLYKIFVENRIFSYKKILLLLYTFEVIKILLFIVLCIFIFKYVTLNELLYFISLCFIQVLLFCFYLKKAFK